MSPHARLFLLFSLAGSILFGSCGSDEENPANPNNTALERSGRMVKIPAKGKSFSMGSTTGNADERPVHQVTFTYDFWIDTTEVTQADYHATMQAVYAGYLAPSWHAPYGVGPKNPAYQVEWDDAVLYCNARSKLEGLDTVYRYTGIVGVPGNGCKLEGLSVDFAANGYRLPTEAEWEYACRAGSTTDYSWGKSFGPYPSSSADSADFSAHAVWAGNAWVLSSDDPSFGTHPVASRIPNAWGLYDMSGNVWEWCNDWYGEDTYAAGAVTDPKGPSTGSWHVLRGGSWGNDAAVLRSAQRTFLVPDYQYYFIGFRVVRPAR